MLNVKVTCFVSLILCYYFTAIAEAGFLKKIFQKNSTPQQTHQDYKSDEEELQGEAAYWASYPETSYRKFDLKQGKQDVIAILQQIENYLPTYVNLKKVKAAKDLDGLISAANNSLTENQDDQVLQLDIQDRTSLFYAISAFQENFKEKMKDSGHGESQPPLMYLLVNIKNTHNQQIEEIQNNNNNGYESDDNSLRGFTNVNFDHLGNFSTNYDGDSNEHEDEEYSY